MSPRLIASGDKKPFRERLFPAFPLFFPLLLICAQEGIFVCPLPAYKCLMEKDQCPKGVKKGQAKIYFREEKGSVMNYSKRTGPRHSFF